MEFNTTRRGFLFGAAAALAATALPGDVFANAYVDKITQLAVLYDRAIALNARCDAKDPSVTWGMASNASTDVIHFLMDNFEKPSEADMQPDSEASRKVFFMFNGYEKGEENPTHSKYISGQGWVTKMTNQEKFARINDYTRTWRDVPATMMESIIPVAVIRDMLAVRRLKLDPNHKRVKKDGSEYQPFVVFADNYQYLILAA